MTPNARSSSRDHIFSETCPENGARMKGKSAHAFNLATPVQFEREKDVGRLGLAIGGPAIIVAALEVGVLKSKAFMGSSD